MPALIYLAEGLAGSTERSRASVLPRRSPSIADILPVALVGYISFVGFMLPRRDLAARLGGRNMGGAGGRAAHARTVLPSSLRCLTSALRPLP